MKTSIHGSGMVSYMEFGFSPVFRPREECQLPYVHTSITSGATDHPGIVLYIMFKAVQPVTEIPLLSLCFKC